MPEQTRQLFDLPQFDTGPKRPKNPCTPAPIGSGPPGTTCRTCINYVRAEYHNKVYLKCGLMVEHWTHGTGTDIKAGWHSCRAYFEAPKEKPE